MFAKLLVVGLFLAILASMGSGLFHLVKGESADGKALKALTWRIGLSVVLFLTLLVMFATGVIEPHGVNR